MERIRLASIIYTMTTPVPSISAAVLQATTCSLMASAKVKALQPQRHFKVLPLSTIVVIYQSDINECARGIDNCIDPSETCANTDGGFTCSCSRGYDLIGSVCVG